MTTSQAVRYLIQKELGVTLILLGNPNIHIFKDTRGIICKGEYGNGYVEDFDYWNYEDCKWAIQLV